MNARVWSCFGMVAVGVAVAGCGGDPIVGSWQSSSCGVLTAMPPPVAAPCETVMQFSADSSLTITSTATVDAANAMFGNCRFIARVTGTWLTGTGGSPMSITLTAQNPATLEVAGCTNSSLNRAAAPSANLTFPTISGTYRIDGNMLVLMSSGGTSSFVRR